MGGWAWGGPESVLGGAESVFPQISAAPKISSPPEENVSSLINLPPAELRKVFADEVEYHKTTSSENERKSLLIISNLVKQLQDIDLPASLDSSKFHISREATLKLGVTSHNIKFSNDEIKFGDSTPPGSSTFYNYGYSYKDRAIKEWPEDVFKQMLHHLAANSLDQKAMADASMPEKIPEERHKVSLLGSAPAIKPKSP